jgi:hypothetical protein
LHGREGPSVAEGERDGYPDYGNLETAAAAFLAPYPGREQGGPTVLNWRALLSDI